MLNLGKLIAGISTRTLQTLSSTRIDRKIYLSTLKRADHELSNDLNKNADANNALEGIMKTVPPESGALSPGDTLNIFRMMNKTFNADVSSITFKLNEHPNFSILREAAQVSIPYYKPGEIIDMFRTILSLNVPLEDSLSNLMITTLRTQTYDMNLNEIMLLDSFLRIRGRQKTKLAKALQLDLIQRFNLITSKTHLNFSHFEYMRRVIRFVHLNWHAINKKVLENFSRNASEQELDINTAENAMIIIMELSRSPDGCKYFKAILNKAFNVWNNNDVSIEMIQRVLSVFIQGKSCVDNDLFNDKRFVRKCAQKVMETCDFNLCFLIQSQFNKLKFVDYELMGFLSDYVAEIDLTAPDAPSKIVTYCRACNVGAYVPPNAVIEHIQQFPFEKYFDSVMNWPMFACQLHSLGIHQSRLIETILENEKFLEKFKVHVDCLKDIQKISTENSTYNDSNKKFAEDLMDIVGSNKLFESFRIGMNLTIPFLIKVDKLTRILLPFDKQTNKPLRRSGREELIAILCEPKTSELPAFDVLCTNLTERKFSIIVLDESWKYLPLSKQVEQIFTSIGSILRNKKKIIRTSCYTE